MTKHEYRAAYREARKQARFISTFWGGLKKLDSVQLSFPDQCPGFTFSRLHGDPLRSPGFRRPVECHQTLLRVLRHVHPRLPA